MFDKISMVRRLSQIGTLIMTRLTGEEVGTDDFGNRYFRSRRRAKGMREKRWVLYRAETEPSLVPPAWFGWLHYQCDQPLPSAGESAYPWGQKHRPNLTGSAAAYSLQADAFASRERGPQSWNPPT